MPGQPPTRSIKDFFRPSNTLKLATHPPSSPLTDHLPNSQAVEGTSHNEPVMISSSLSIPPSTASSKRIEYKGHEFVRGSDEDSEGSLPDLDVIINQSMRSKLDPKPRHVSEEIRKTEKQKKPFGSSFEALMKQAQANHERKFKLEDIDKKLREDGTASYFSNETNLEATEEALASILPDSSDEKGSKAKRVTRAIQRTEALQYEPVFHFFGESPPQNLAKFPKECLPGDGWAKSLLGTTRLVVPRARIAN
jgi:hypothetical protein